MQRLVLAVLFVALAAAAVAFLLRIFFRAAKRAGKADVFETESAMQKIAFFLLLCLMGYVSLSGAS